jgi:hypothetical protein
MGAGFTGGGVAGAGVVAETATVAIASNKADDKIRKRAARFLAAVAPAEMCGE